LYFHSHTKKCIGETTNTPGGLQTYLHYHTLGVLANTLRTFLRVSTLIPKIILMRPQIHSGAFILVSTIIHEGIGGTTNTLKALLCASTLIPVMILMRPPIHSGTFILVFTIIHGGIGKALFRVSTSILEKVLAKSLIPRGPSYMSPQSYTGRKN
jgi:ribosomal protein S19